VVIVVGKDLKVAQIINFEGRAIINKYLGRMVDKTVMEKEWTPLLGYNPIWYLLTRGWIGVIFKSNTDADIILVGQWYWDHHLFFSKSWHPLFDVKEECIFSFPIWIKLPNLGLEFWLEEGFKSNGDVLGVRDIQVRLWGHMLWN
jgi:hypothetical protein